jgi:hypothetical protein
MEVPYARGFRSVSRDGHACGTRDPDREVGGAATRAGTGAVVGLPGGPVGVVAGAPIGAGTGAVVRPGALNLGAPPWSGEQPAY